MHYKDTDYGFEWGALTVERQYSDKKRGCVVLGLQAGGRELQIYVTKTGKIVVIDTLAGRELK